MIQDIAPKKFKNEFFIKDVKSQDTVLCYEKGAVLCLREDENITLPTASQLNARAEDCTFIFSIDDTDYFLLRKKAEVIPEGFGFEGNVFLRTALPRYSAFAAFVGLQLNNWYNDTVFCGRCGEKLVADRKERMMRCEHCGNMIYPKICPGVIVAVINKDKLLLTRYANRPGSNYALIAGFTEIGEPLEKTVEREVMEEVGLKVKNITFYKSQPWAYSSSLLAGFFAELDGDDTITLQEDELAEAKWYTADEIDAKADQMSLTREMTMLFKDGKVPPFAGK